MSLPAEISAVLPRDTADRWDKLAPVVPVGAYLAGGTALAVHLRHRVSRDLDFFFHDELDLDGLIQTLQSVGPFAVDRRDEGTLNGVFSQTKLQFLSAAGQQPLEPTSTVAGIQVAGLSDILAMKLKVIGDRGELRDYFDVMAIERETGRTTEEGLALYLARYNLTAEHVSFPHIVTSLGHLDDVADDDALPIGRDKIESYWKRRQPEVIRNISRFPVQPARRETKAPPSPRAQAASPASGPTSGLTGTAPPGQVWVDEYERSNGTTVRGHWRAR